SQILKNIAGQVRVNLHSIWQNNWFSRPTHYEPNLFMRKVGLEILLNWLTSITNLILNERIGVQEKVRGIECIVFTNKKMRCFHRLMHDPFNSLKGTDPTLNTSVDINTPT